MSLYKITSIDDSTFDPSMSRGGPREFFRDGFPRVSKSGKAHLDFYLCLQDWPLAVLDLLIKRTCVFDCMTGVNGRRRGQLRKAAALEHITIGQHDPFGIAQEFHVLHVEENTGVA